MKAQKFLFLWALLSIATIALLRSIRAVDGLNDIVKVAVVKQIDAIRVAALSYAQNDMSIGALDARVECLIFGHILRVAVCGKEVLYRESECVIQNLGKQLSVWLRLVETVVDDNTRLKILLHLRAPGVCAQVVMRLEGVGFIFTDKVAAVVCSEVLWR